MIKDNNLSFEDYVLTQKTSRTRALQTTSAYKQNLHIRNHIADWLLHKFDWHYWVTFTFGYEPDLTEAQDVLYVLHHRIDTRILKHSNLSVMDQDARSKWILFPEYANRGLHYHGFMQINTHPRLGSQPSEWWWFDSALRYQTEKLSGCWRERTVFPARAGMNRPPRRWRSRWTSVPRTRGDEPIVDHTSEPHQLCSPQGQGQRPHEVRE